MSVTTLVVMGMMTKSGIIHPAMDMCKISNAVLEAQNFIGFKTSKVELLHVQTGHSFSRVLPEYIRRFGWCDYTATASCEAFLKQLKRAVIKHNSKRNTLNHTVETMFSCEVFRNIVVAFLEQQPINSQGWFDHLGENVCTKNFLNIPNLKYSKISKFLDS